MQSAPVAHAEIGVVRRSRRAQFDADQVARAVDHQHRNAERRDPARVFGFEDHVGRLVVAADAADRRADEHARARSRFASSTVEARRLDRFLRRRHAELLVEVAAAHFFRQHVLRRIPVLDFGGDLDRVIGRVEVRDQSDSALAGLDVVPRFRDRVTERRNHPHTRHYHTSCHALLPLECYPVVTAAGPVVRLRQIMPFHPRRAVGANFLLPDRHDLFQAVDAVTRRLEAALIAMS